MGDEKELWCGAKGANNPLSDHRPQVLGYKMGFDFRPWPFFLTASVCLLSQL